MSSPADLPGRTSHTEELGTLHPGVLREASPFCGTTSALARFFGRTRRAVSLRSIRNGFIALSIPAALLAGTVLPRATQPAVAVRPAAAAHAAQSSLLAFAGDAPVAEEATADEWVFAEGDTKLAAPASKLVPVTVEVANLRSGPSTDYQRLGKLRQGQTVKLLGRSGQWFQVETSNGTKGWMHGELLQVEAGVASTLAAVNVAAKVRIGTVVDDQVHLRSGPGTQHESLGKLGRGTQLEILREENGWYRVATARGNVGYITARFFKPGQAAVVAAAPAAPAAAAAPAAGPSRASVAVNNVNLRYGPATAYNTYGKMAAGTTLEVLARSGEWYKVRSPRGTIGWVANELVKISSAVAASVPVTKEIPALPKKAAAPAAGTAVAAAAPAASGRNGSAARIALQFIGARYRWGGAGPGGFDCSGLTSYVYGRMGKFIPHSAAAQFSTRYGARVSLNNLAAGDLVFFANTAGRGITHVAIYVGGGMMVSANTPRTGVQYVSLYGKYWMNHYAGAIRPY